MCDDVSKHSLYAIRVQTQCLSGHLSDVNSILLTTAKILCVIATEALRRTLNILAM